MPKEIIPDSVTLNAFAYRKDPLILPVLLKYLTHKSLLKEAKKDLDEVNKKLQEAIDKDIKDLQNEKAKLQKDKTTLNSVEISSEEAKALAIDKIDKPITGISSQVEEIELCKEDTKNLLSGKEVKMNSYPSQYFSVLEDELAKVMEKKLKAYVKDTDVEKTYQSLNSRAEKITRVRNAKNMLLTFAQMAVIIPSIVVMGLGMFCMGVQHGPQPSFLSPTINITLFYIAPIALSISVALFTIAGVAHLVNRHYDKSFVKEMENFIGETQDKVEDLPKGEMETLDISGLPQGFSKES